MDEVDLTIEKLIPKLIDFRKKAPDEIQSEEAASLANDINSLIESGTNGILGEVQLEEGEYVLTLIIDYRPIKSKVKLRMKNAQSSISFKIEENFREFYRIKLRETLKAILKDRLQIALGEESTGFQFPEYNPSHLEEI